MQAEKYLIDLSAKKQESEKDKAIEAIKEVLSLIGENTNRESCRLI